MLSTSTTELDLRIRILSSSLVLFVHPLRREGPSAIILELFLKPGSLVLRHKPNETIGLGGIACVEARLPVAWTWGAAVTAAT